MKKIYILFFFFLLLKNFSVAQEFSTVWSTLYSDSTTYTMHINYHVVDAKGNSYVAGYKQYYYELYKGNYQATHLFLLKVNAAGKQEWIRHFDNQNDSIDYPYGLALDTSGNIFITCSRIDTVINTSSYGSKISDIVTMKYDADGNRVWLNRYHHADYKQAQPSGIAVSGKGEIVVTGSDDLKAIAEKIDKDGNTLWIKKSSDLVFNTACFDNDGNIIIGGASDSYHTYQEAKPMVIKLSLKGKTIWSNIFNEYEKYGRIYFVQCDSVNNIFANGQTDINSFNNIPQIITLKYNTAGTQQWFSKEENYSYTQPPYNGDFAIDASGNSYVTGYIRPFSGNNYNWLITKYSTDGRRKWIAHFDDSLHGYDTPAKLALAKDGTAYVTGNTDEGQQNFEILTMAYNKQGNVTASDIYKAAKHSTGGGRGIGLDKKGNVYISAEVGFGKDTNNYVTVIKYEIKKSLPAVAESPYKTIYDLKLFPNPAKNTLNVMFTVLASIKNYSLVIRDVSGTTVLFKQLNAEEKIINIGVNINQLKAGVYTASIFDGINSVSKTFIKE